MSLGHSIMEGVRDYGNAVGIYTLSALVVDSALSAGEAFLQRGSSFRAKFVDNLSNGLNLGIAAVGGLVIGSAYHSHIPVAEYLGQVSAIGMTGAAVPVIVKAGYEARRGARAAWTSVKSTRLPDAVRLAGILSLGYVVIDGLERVITKH